MIRNVTDQERELTKLLAMAEEALAIALDISNYVMEDMPAHARAKVTPFWLAGDEYIAKRDEYKKRYG